MSAPEQCTDCRATDVELERELTGEYVCLPCHLMRQSPRTAPERQITFDDKGEMLLPGIPAHHDQAGLAQWVTVTFALNLSHPITKGRLLGVAGPEGHVQLKRAGAEPIRFEPASRLNTPAKLIEALSWCTLPTDGMTPAYKAKHCRQIVYVVRALCGHGERVTATDEAAGIVATFLYDAHIIEGFTITGTSPQRYEAAAALKRDRDDSGWQTGPPRCLRDANTGAYVIRVGELQEMARRYIGGSIARGFVDARMAAYGWQRLTLDGHAVSGREGRTAEHLRCDVYCGFIPAVESRDA